MRCIKSQLNQIYRRKYLEITPIKPIFAHLTDNQFYREIWSERKHECENCGRFLGDKLYHVFCAHILAKGAFPRFRHLKRNIALLCHSCHHQFDFGDRNSFITITDRLQQLKQEYYAPRN